MKKMLLMAMIFVAALVLAAGQSQAGMTGSCSTCHTMHYSQDGTVPTDAQAGGPFPVLLKNGADCLGCHADDPAAGTDLTVNGAPQVAHAALSSLAGGNFSFVNTNETYGHNVLDLNAQDTLLLNVPPGGTTIGSRLTCSLATGCHGNRGLSGSQMADLAGAHHGNNNYTGTNAQLNTATTVANSYRFLKGVKGTEHSNWNVGATAANHNEYFSDASTHGISTLCADCHTDFHGTGTTDGADWIRHPVDVAIGATYATNYGTTYDLTVPVGRTTVAASADAVGATDTVICLSCHVAHAGQRADALRWESSTIGTDNVGCNLCHSK